MSLPLLFHVLYILTLPLTLRLPSRVPKRSCTLSLSSKASGGGEDLEGRSRGRIQKAASSRAQLKKTQFLSSSHSSSSRYHLRLLPRPRTTVKGAVLPSGGATNHEPASTVEHRQRRPLRMN
ncbi:hypothetical protein JHK85_006649 [Glycine max]|nr:hypothetical protein JHK85_006649 [Glycine max]